MLILLGFSRNYYFSSPPPFLQEDQIKTLMNRLLNLLAARTLFCLLLLSSNAFAQVKILSWNIQNIGKSKSPQEIAFIAKTIRDYDLIAIQEVVAGKGGPQAVARLADELNRSGFKWDYALSAPTTGTTSSSERYAFLWKTATLKKIGKAWLEQSYQREIDREPYLCTFAYQGKEFTLASFHAIPKSKMPETEIKYFKFLAAAYPKLNLIFAGDFNCPQSHSVFNPLKKMGYRSALQNQKTSLKMACKQNECLASEYDNIYYPAAKTKVLRKGIIPFYKSFPNLKKAREISDHIPVWAEVSFN